MTPEIQEHECLAAFDRARVEYLGGVFPMSAVGRTAMFFDGHLTITEVRLILEDTPSEYRCKWYTGILPHKWGMKSFTTVRDALHCINSHRHEVIEAMTSNQPTE